MEEEAALRANFNVHTRVVVGKYCAWVGRWLASSHALRTILSARSGPLINGVESWSGQLASSMPERGIH